MNLIRNTLIFVVLLQLLGFLYFKLFYQEAEPPIQLIRTIILPQSTAYTSYTENISDNIQTKNTFSTEPIPLKKPLLTLADKNTLLKKKSPNSTKISPNNCIKSKKPLAINKKVESYAKELLGFKYVWGATGPKTFDCSGFTQKVYRKIAGINLPRVSKNQAKVGKYIEYNRLKKGDMVFFDTEKKYTKKVNHVGIYLGNNKFIHASSARKKIIITSFKRKPFYKRRFLWGRRVLNDNYNVNLAMLLRKNLRR